MPTLSAEPEWVEVNGSLFAHVLVEDGVTRCGRSGQLAQVMSRPARETQARCPLCDRAAALPP